MLKNDLLQDRDQITIKKQQFDKKVLILKIILKNKMIRKYCYCRKDVRLYNSSKIRIKFADVFYGWSQSLKKYWRRRKTIDRTANDAWLAVKISICNLWSFWMHVLCFFIIKVFLLLFQVFWLTMENTKTSNMERPVAIQRPQTALLTKYEKLVCLSYWVQVWPPCRFCDYFYSFA